MVKIDNMKELKQFIDEMKNTSSLNEKKKIIEKYKDNEFVMKAVRYTYDPYKKYNVTSKNCKKLSHICDEDCGFVDLFELLDDLDNRTYTGHDAIAMVNGFVYQSPGYEDVIFGIIDRNIEIRANASVFNKIVPGLIPTFDVALATKYESRFCDFDNERWLASRKLDGVRCIVRKEGDTIKAFSRAGNEFTTLQKVLDDVSLMSGDFVLDGEICLMDENGNEDFQGIMKQIKRKNHTIENPKYIIFDYLSLKEFDTKESDIKLSERIKELKGEIHHDGYYDTLSVLKQVYVKDVEHLNDMIAEADKAGYEGVMLRKNVGYEGKRSKNLLKCKKFHDAEYKVIGATNGDIRVIEDGKEKTINCLSMITINHKGTQVGVGSGFNFDQRKEFGKDHSKILGKTITVQYFEESKNQQGEYSLRFPVIKHIFENGRNV
tara:strand:- start:1134 stop:2432 length:1299 start_codon:yes stop_codon:yes gene_type:complete